MECYKVLNILYKYAEHDLAPAMENEVKNHLENCSDCNNKFQNIEETFNIIDFSQQPKPSYNFTNEVINRIINTRETQKQIRPVYKTINTPLQKVAFISSLAAAICIGVYFGITTDKPASRTNIIEMYATQLNLDYDKPDVFNDYLVQTFNNP